ncbi:MAG: TIGR02556 family CRISPR-associated protein [Candidatus Muiribacteriota bacterium]
MIHKMYKLHEYIDDEFFEDNPYGLVTVEREEQVVILEFESGENGTSFDYKGSYLEKFNAEKNKQKIFFKKVAARGTSEFPSVFVSYKDIQDNNEYFSEKKKKGKIITILKKYNNDEKISALNQCFLDNAEKIKESIKESMQGRKTDKDLYILSLKIDDKYIGESEIFYEIRKKTKENILAPYFTFDNKIIKGKNKFCSVCLANNKEVWGYVSTFNFYTSKTEFAPIAGGMDKTNAWKNYPVCPDCAVKLKEVKPIIENYMSYYFCGFNYYLIPEFLISHTDNSEIMDYFLDKENALGKFSLSEQARNTITNSNSDILDIIKDTDNRVNYTMLFCKKNNNEFKILMSIEDVYPSQFKVIFNAKDKAEQSGIFKELKGKKETYDLKFKFEFIKDFMGELEKSFLEVVRSVFLHKRIDSNFLMRKIAEFIRSKYANNENISLSVLKIFMTLKFLNNLNIINLSLNKKEDNLELEYNDFFAEHKDFFNNPAKKTVFLEGVLCQKLLNIQYQNREATPFKNKLNGLKLNPKLIKKLFPEIIAKLEQYDSNYYKKLEEVISKLFLDSNLDELSNDEISFYFAMGMTLHKEIINNESGKNDNSETE